MESVNKIVSSHECEFNFLLPSKRASAVFRRVTPGKLRPDGSVSKVVVSAPRPQGTFPGFQRGSAIAPSADEHSPWSFT